MLQLLLSLKKLSFPTFSSPPHSQESGSADVVEVHGGIGTTTCTACKDLRSSDGARQQLAQGKTVPRCQVCDGVLKLDVVLFGEALSQQAMSAAAVAASTADVIIVVGTSLAVSSAMSQL